VVAKCGLRHEAEPLEQAGGGHVRGHHLDHHLGDAAVRRHAEQCVHEGAAHAAATVGLADNDAQNPDMGGPSASRSKAADAGDPVPGDGDEPGRAGLGCPGGDTVGVEELVVEECSVRWSDVRDEGSECVGVVAGHRPVCGAHRVTVAIIGVALG
jgi:hypothetical protein